MLFNSIDFFFFFPVVIFLFFALPHRYRWVLLLAASYYFYMSWKLEYVLLIILSTLIDYFAGLKMSEKQDKAGRRPYLLLSIACNLGMLFLFKYFNFFFEAVQDILSLANMEYMVPVMHLALPIGISFYTFQTMSYSIDIYRGTTEVEKHPGIFALYVSYFPQLVAGPIERSSHLIPQLKQKIKFDYDRVTNGLKLMGWGFFKKVLVADQIAPMMDYAYAQPDSFHGLSVILIALLFIYQVYCDFSGYSDIAIGAAQVMGVQLMENFRRPFFSQSLAELWTRWHISLSRWFLDYFYIPLGGNRRGKWITYRNLVIVFFVTGLWHGASWNYIIWGLLQGGVIIVSRTIPKTKAFFHRLSGLHLFPRLDKAVQIIITILIFGFICIYFRAGSIADAHAMIFNVTKGWGENLRSIFFNEGRGREHALYLGYSMFEFMLTMSFILILESLQYIQEKRGSLRLILASQPTALRWSLYLILASLIVLFSFERQIPFIYFQF